MIGRPFQKGHKNTHDVAAAGRKGKSNSPWRHGCSWLSGMGNADARVRAAANRERVVAKRYPGAHRRPCFSMEDQQ